MIGGAVGAVALRSGIVVAPHKLELHEESMLGFLQRAAILAMHHVNSTLSLKCILRCTH